MVPNEKRQTTRHRRKRGSISADEIVEGAFAVARRRSLDQLSMPRLAEHLGVGVTSLYWYFRKKSDLLGAMTDVAVDRFLARMPAVRTEDSWQRAMLEHFTAQRTVHREDEVLSDLLLTRTSSYGAEATRRTMELIEAMVGKLVDAGFTPTPPCWRTTPSRCTRGATSSTTASCAGRTRPPWTSGNSA